MTLNETKDIIFTTAFKDINRSNWNCFIRTNQTYINYFYNLADNINYNLVVYVENSIKEIMLNQHSFNNNIIFMDIDSINSFFNKYLENDTKIIQSDIYKSKIPFNRKHNPEHVYAEYNLINHSKINFVNNTKKLFGDYKYYSWIDFGIMNANINNIPKDINISLLEEKIIYHCTDIIPNERISEDEMLKSNSIYFLGSAFIVHTKLVEHFEKIWENKIIEWQEKYVTDDDQNLIVQLYFDNPEIFQKIENTEWFGFFRKLKKEE